MRSRRAAAVALIALGVAAGGAGCGDLPRVASSPASTGSSGTATLPTAPGVATTAPGAAASHLDDAGDPLFPGLGNGGYDVDRYVLRLRTAPSAGTLAGTVRVEAVATRPLGPFHLDLDGLEVEAVRVDGTPATFDHRDGELVVTPAGTVAPGAGFTVEVDYGGRPVTRRIPGVGIRTGWVPSSDGSYTLNQPDAARTWFPVNDHPSDKARYRFEITVPEGYVAVTNGWPLDGDHSGRPNGDGTRTFVSEMEAPMASYLVQVAVGRFDVLTGTGPGGLRLRSVVPEGTPHDDLDRLGRVVARLSERYGPYPFDSLGTLVVPAAIGGALETQALPVYDALPPEWLLVHEVAHQWFGNAVSPARWDDIWLNEAPATWTEAWWVGRDALLDASLARGRDLDDRTAGSMFDEVTYEGGAGVMQELRAEVGDDVFTQVLRAWVERYRGSAGTTEQFVAVASAVSGRDLEPFFAPYFTRSPPSPSTTGGG